MPLVRDGKETESIEIRCVYLRRADQPIMMGRSEMVATYRPLKLLGKLHSPPRKQGLWVD